MRNQSNRRVTLQLIREEPPLMEEPQSRHSEQRRVLWLFVGIALLVFSSEVFTALYATKQSWLGYGAVFVIWLQAYDCFVRSYRSTR
jgi:hypothetical protein